MADSPIEATQARVKRRGKPCSPGEVYGKWTVLNEAQPKWGNCKKRVFACRCECRTEKDIEQRHLRNGLSKSCGCGVGKLGWHKGRTGRSNNPLYTRWGAMMKRCYDPSSRGYRRYGMRGIRVADQWHDFEAFYNDLGPAPSPNHSLERINNDEGYGPGNVIWATAQVQNRNKSTNITLTYAGETMVASDWATRLGCRTNVITRRISRGWPVEAVLTLPITRKKPHLRA